MFRKYNTNDDAKLEAIKTIIDHDSFIVITKNEAVISLTQKDVETIIKNSLKTFEGLMEDVQVSELANEEKEEKKQDKEPSDIFDDFIKYLREHKK